MQPVFSQEKSGEREKGEKEKKAHRSAQETSKPKKKEIPSGAMDKIMEEQVLLELRRREKRRKLIVLAASVVAVASLSYFGVYYFVAARNNASYEQLAALKGSDVLADAKDKMILRSIRPQFSSRMCWMNIKLYTKRIKS